MPPEKMSADETARAVRESGLTACLALGASEMGRDPSLDALARTGALVLVNPDTRPTSFNPVWNNPQELDGMSQRMILTAQANGRYPNFGGFCYGWDTTGYAVGSRRQLLVYWGWGDKTQALRNYIDRVDKQKMDEFTRRTGLRPVSEEEYLSYVLSIGRPEFGPAIDLPTKLWLDEIARYARPMLAAAAHRLREAAGCVVGLPDRPVRRGLRHLLEEPAAGGSRAAQHQQRAVGPLRGARGPVFPVGIRGARFPVPERLERSGRRARLRVPVAAGGCLAGDGAWPETDVDQQRPRRRARSGASPASSRGWRPTGWRWEAAGSASPAKDSATSWAG